MKRSLRITLLLITGTLLRLLVALFILLATIFSLYSSRNYVYEVLNTTDAYQRIPLVILNSSANQQLGQNDETQLGSEIFAPIVTDASPPEVAELAAQNIVNAYYDWLEGREESVQFTVDLSSSKEAIVDGIVTYAVTRYEQLEECEEAVSGYDFFSVPCQITGLDITQQEQALRDQLEETPLLLRETVYTQDTLLTNRNGESLDEFAPWLRSLYQNSSLFLILSLCIVLVLIVINLVGATSLTKGIKRVGKIIFQGSSGFLITAVFLFILLPLIGFGGSSSNDASSLFWQTQTYDGLVNDIIGKLLDDFIARGVLISLPFVLIGAGGWLYGSYQLEKERHTGVLQANKLTKITLKNSGLVSSEKSSPKRRHKKKKDHSYPIASSEVKATHSNKKSKQKHKKKAKKK